MAKLNIVKFGDETLRKVARPVEEITPRIKQLLDDMIDTMHDAMKLVSLDDIAYGAFISGPSKTADIEQALVMGAHGAMRATVILTE